MERLVRFLFRVVGFMIILIGVPMVVDIVRVFISSGRAGMMAEFNSCVESVRAFWSDFADSPRAVLEGNYVLLKLAVTAMVVAIFTNNKTKA